MADYCSYSFGDLYKAAYKKSLPKGEKEKFASLPQDEINSLVLNWAKKAGWKTQEKVGQDKKIYLSFYP